MATRNLVPRGNNEGSLGIDGQRWSALHVASISTDTLKVTNIQLKANDNLSLFTKGAGIEDISTNGSGQFVIAMLWRPLILLKLLSANLGLLLEILLIFRLIH